MSEPTPMTAPAAPRILPSPPEDKSGKSDEMIVMMSQFIWKLGVKLGLNWSIFGFRNIRTVIDRQS